MNEENGYQVLRPTDPTLEGNTFEGWYTLDGEEFDFKKIVTESVTLYAKWSDVEWTSITSAESHKGGISMPVIFCIGGALILIGAGVIGGIMIKRGNRREKKS